MTVTLHNPARADCARRGLRPINMKPKSSKTKKRKSAGQTMVLAVNAGSAFAAALTKAIEFHRTNPDDPHGIRSAVMVALTEVRDAMRYALNK